MLPLHSSPLSNHWEEAEDIWVISYSFHHVYKKLCAIVNLLPENFSVSSVFGFMYPSLILPLPKMRT